jgi:hypothetical protein
LVPAKKVKKEKSDKPPKVKAEFKKPLGTYSLFAKYVHKHIEPDLKITQISPAITKFKEDPKNAKVVKKINKIAEEAEDEYVRVLVASEILKERKKSDKVVLFDNEEKEKSESESEEEVVKPKKKSDKKKQSPMDKFVTKKK